MVAQSGKPLRCFRLRKRFGVAISCVREYLCPVATENVEQLKSHLEPGSLHHLVNTGEHGKLKRVLHDDPKRLWDRDAAGTTPIIWAYRCGHLSLGRELLEAHAHKCDDSMRRSTDQEDDTLAPQSSKSTWLCTEPAKMAAHTVWVGGIAKNDATEHSIKIWFARCDPSLATKIDTVKCRIKEGKLYGCWALVTFRDTDCVQTAISLGVDAPKAERAGTGKPLPWKVAAAKPEMMKSVQAQSVTVESTLLHRQFSRRVISESVILAQDQGVQFHGQNVLHLAILNGDMEQCKWMVRTYPLLLHAKCTGRFFSFHTNRYYGETALMMAVTTNQETQWKKHLVKFILDQVEEHELKGDGTDILETDHFGNTILHLAVMRDDVAMYQFVLEEAELRAQRSQLRKRFAFYDTDGSGSLDAAEVQILLNTEMGTTAMGMSIDDVLSEMEGHDKDNKVSEEEFLAWYEAGETRTAILFKKQYTKLVEQVRLQGEFAMYDQPPHMQEIIGIKQKQLKWATQLNHDRLSPLTLAAKFRKRRIFAHITQEQSVTVSEYGPFVQQLYPLDGVDVAHGFDFGTHSRLTRAHVMMPGKSALYHICMRGHGKMIPRELQDVLNTKWLKFGRIAFWQRVLTNAVVMIVFTAWTMLDTGPDSWDCCGGGSTGGSGSSGNTDGRSSDFFLAVFVWALMLHKMCWSALGGCAYWRMLHPAHLMEAFSFSRRDENTQEGCVGMHLDEQVFFMVLVLVAYSSWFWIQNYSMTEDGELCPATFEAWTEWQHNAVHMHTYRAMAAFVGWVGWGLYALLGATQRTGVFVIITLKMLQNDVLVFLALFVVVSMGFMHGLFLARVAQHGWLSVDNAPTAHGLINPPGASSDFSAAQVCAPQDGGFLIVSSFAATVLHSGLIAPDGHTEIQGDGNRTDIWMLVWEVLFALLLPAVLLNLLIAKMADTYQGIIDHSTEKFHLERAALMHALEDCHTVNQLNDKRKRYSKQWGAQAWSMVTIDRSATDPDSSSSSESDSDDDDDPDSKLRARFNPLVAAKLGSKKRRSKLESHEAKLERVERHRAREMAMAMRIQARARGYLCRCRYRRTCATKQLQAFWRGTRCRRALKVDNESIIKVQAMFRGRRARKEFKEKTEAIKTIQKSYRHMLSRTISRMEEVWRRGERLDRDDSEMEAMEARPAQSLDATSTARLNEYIKNKWQAQTLYLEGIELQHASVRYIRGLLYGQDYVGRLVSVNVRRRPHKKCWAFISFASRAGATQMLKHYRTIRGIPDTWRLSHMDRTKVSEHDVEGMRVLEASMEAGENWYDKERGKARRAKAQARSTRARSAATAAAAFAHQSSTRLEPETKSSAGTGSGGRRVQWSNRPLPQPEPEPDPEPEPQPEPTPVALQTPALPALPDDFTRDISTPMTPQAASAEASSIAQAALQTHADNYKVQEAARKLMQAEERSKRHQT